MATQNEPLKEENLLDLGVSKTSLHDASRLGQSQARKNLGLCPFPFGFEQRKFSKHIPEQPKSTISLPQSLSLSLSLYLVYSELWYLLCGMCLGTS